MCCRRGGRRQPPIVALAGAIYGAYQSRKDKRAEASAREISLTEEEHASTPKQSLPEAMDGLALQEKGVPPPDYEDVVANRSNTLHYTADSKQTIPDLHDESDDEDAFLAAEESGEPEEKTRDELQAVKLSFFERLQARKEAKRIGREERREAWRAEKKAWRAARAERRMEWRAARAERMGRGGCCRRAC